MNYLGLQSELLTDPLARGYAGMTDIEAADNLNVADRTVNRSTLSGSEIFEAIDLTEWKGLSADAQARVRTVLELGDSIQVGPTTKARAFLLDAFGAGTTTRTNLVALVQQTVSRADELGLGFVRPGDVQFARTL